MRLYAPLCLFLLASCSATNPQPTPDAAKVEPADILPPATDVLSGHAWQQAGPAARNAAGAELPRAWLRFNEQQIDGNTSCNGLNGSYTLSGTGNALSFGPLAISKRFCTDTAANEKQFMAALQATATYYLSGGQLQLIDANGGVVLTLEPRPEQAERE